MRLPNRVSSRRSPAPCCDRSSATEIPRAQTSKNHHAIQFPQTRAEDATQPPDREKRESDLQVPAAPESRSMQRRAKLCPRSRPAVAATVHRRATLRSSAAPPRKTVLRYSQVRRNRSPASYRKRRWIELLPS